MEASTQTGYVENITGMDASTQTGYIEIITGMEPSAYPNNSNGRYDETQCNSFYEFSSVIADAPKFSEYDVAIKTSDLQKMNSLYETPDVYDYCVVLNLCIEHNNLEFFKIFFNPESIYYISFIFSCVDYGRFDFIDFLRPIVEVEIYIYDGMTVLKYKK